jgi:hypothetical protein
MTKQFARAAPENSMVLIVGSNDVEIPQEFGGALIAATTSCIAVGCKSETDGQTQFVLGARSEVDPGNTPNFENSLDTSSGFVRLETVLGQPILEMTVSSSRTVVSIWANHAAEPDLLLIGIAPS